MSTACLVGNGLSIAYNPDLVISSVTAELMKAQATPGGAATVQTTWAQAVESLSARAPSKDVFEDLLGPLERLPPVLAGLAKVQSLLSSSNSATRARHLNQSRAILKSMYREGVGDVLSIIDGHAHNQGSLQYDYVLAFVKKVLSWQTTNSATSFASLNYDSLLNSLVVDATGGACTDLADPRGRSIFDLGGGVLLDGIPIRTVDDMMDSRTRVYDLHGSMAWWADPFLGMIAKFEMADLRTSAVVRRWRERQIDWNPMVLLTDQKSERATQDPFSLAYSGFERRLLEAELWVIVGYSFGDEPVNKMLARAARRSSHLTEIHVYDKPSDAAGFKARVLLSLPEPKVNWHLKGI